MSALSVARTLVGLLALAVVATQWANASTLLAKAERLSSANQRVLADPCQGKPCPGRTAEELRAWLR